MRELLRSKAMFGFVIFVFGILFINSMSINRELKTDKEENNNIKIVYNR